MGDALAVSIVLHAGRAIGAAIVNLLHAFNPGMSFAAAG